jgi:1,4-dihydroxy-2-naphthoate octaprenyltransferase
MTLAARRLLWDTWAFICLGRPLFLAGGVVFHCLGAALALYAGHRLSVTALILGQIVITATQLMTQYANDYFDLIPDRANRNLTPWSGGSRILPDGRLSPATALTAARVLMSIALAGVALIALIVRPAPLAISLLLVGMALAWFYSAPPIRLVERGLGELTAAIVVPGLTTLSGLTLQGGEIGLVALLAILPPAFFQFAMLLAVAFPDAEADAATGKRTLVVRLYGERAAWLHSLVLIMGFLTMLLGLIVLAVRVDISLGMSLLLIWIVTLPFGLWHGARVALGAWCDPRRWGSVAFWGVALLTGIAALEVIAFAWGAIQRGMRPPFL